MCKINPYSDIPTKKREENGSDNAKRDRRHTWAPSVPAPTGSPRVEKERERIMSRVEPRYMEW